MKLQPLGLRSRWPLASLPEVEREAHALYSFLENQDSKNFPHRLKGSDGDGAAIVQDRDRLSGRECAIFEEDRNFDFGWTLRIRQKDSETKFQKVKLPRDFVPDDLSYHHSSRKVALHGYNSSCSQWQVLVLKVPPHFGFLSRPAGEVVHQAEVPLAGIEWSAQGELLAAQEKQVLKLGAGGLEPILELGSRVRDLNTLSTGGLCLNLEANNPIQTDLIYLDSEQAQPVQLKLPRSFQENFNPSRSHSVVIKPAHWESPIYGRSQELELGPILRPGEHSRQTPFGLGIDASSALWSPDGRFFSVTSAKLRHSVGDVRDSLIWDTQAQQVYQLPNVVKVDFVEGNLELQHRRPAESVTVQPEQLEQLLQTPWYQKNFNSPVYCLDDQKLHVTYRQDGRTELIEGNSKIDYARDRGQQFLVGVDGKDKIAKFWDLETGLQFQTPGQARLVYWDRERDEVGLIAGEPPRLELVSGADLKQTRWYREALARKVFPTMEATAPIIARDQQAGTINGLKMPKKEWD